MSGARVDAGPSYAWSGWFEAAAYVMTIGALSLTYAYGHTIGAHPTAFILYAMLVSALAMLGLTGLGNDAAAIMLHPRSWIAGAAIILIEVFFYVAIGYASPAHATLVVRISIPLAMLAGAVLYRRRPPVAAALGALAIVVILGIVVWQTNANVRAPMGLAAVLAGFFMVVRGFASEFHPWNRAARTVHEKIRVTGLVVLVTSIMSLVLTALASGLIAQDLIPRTTLVPTLAELTDGPTVLLGCCVGGVILTLMAYLNFSCVVKITTENFTAMMAFTPVATWVMQSIGTGVGIVQIAPLADGLIIAMAGLVGSVLVIFWAGRRARQKAVA